MLISDFAPITPRDINTGEVVEQDWDAQRKQAERYWDRMHRLQNTPEVYAEYLKLKNTDRGGEAESLFIGFSEKTEGIYCGNRAERLSADGMSLKEDMSTDYSVYQDTLQELSNRYNAEFYLKNTPYIVYFDRVDQPSRPN